MRRFKNVIVLTAMPQEETAILELLVDHRIGRRVFGRRLPLVADDFQIGEIEVIVARSGMGAVNAALILHALVENQSPERPIDAVILLGVGGSIAPGLAIGDLVLSTAVFQHDYFSSLEFGDPRMLPGDLIVAPEQTVGYSALMPADRDLVEMIASAAAEIRVWRGVVASGGEFVGTVARKRYLNSLCEGSLLVDMEAAGVAQVCRKLDLPFAVAKTVADRLEPDGSIESDFRACLDLAARNAALVVKDFLAADA